MSEYSWRHQTLIQALLSRGPLEEDQFHLIFKGVTGKPPDTHRKLFNDYLLKINKALSFAQFELRCCKDQYDGRVYYGMVNNVLDEQSKLGTKYSVLQIAFYKAIIEAILQDASAHGKISNIDALNLRLENQVPTEKQSQSQGSPSHIPPAFKNFSVSHKEKTLQELVDDQWLYCTPEGYIKLGVRSFLDLRSWFRSNDVPSCEVCNEAGVKAKLCPKEACTVRVHQYCLKKLFSKRKGERACPSCGTDWQSRVPKSELIEDGDEPDSSTQRQPPSGSKRKKARTDYNSNVDATASGSQPISDLRRTTRSSARLSARRESCCAKDCWRIGLKVFLIHMKCGLVRCGAVSTEKP